MVTYYFKAKPNWALERLKRVKDLNNNDDYKNNEEISLFNPVSGLSPVNGFTPINNNNLSRMKNNNSPTMDRQIKAFKLPPGTVTSIDCEC